MGTGTDPDKGGQPLFLSALYISIMILEENKTLIVKNLKGVNLNHFLISRLESYLIFETPVLCY